MNYITRLRKELAQEKAQIAAFKNSLDCLENYVRSEKFRQEPMVSVIDIIVRIQDARNNAFDAGWQTEQSGIEWKSGGHQGRART